MSNSCHMQYGRALRWAWGCLMRSSLIYWEREGEQGEGERERQDREEKRAKQREIQITNKTAAVVDFGQMYQTIQSRNNIFPVQRFQVSLCVCVCVRHGK